MPVPVGLDRDHVDVGRRTGRADGERRLAARRASRAAPAARARCIASSPTAPGTRSGPRPTTRPTTSRSTTSGALLVATGSKGKVYRVAGDPAQTTLLARAVGAAGHHDRRRPRPRRAAGHGQSGQGLPAVGAPGDDRHRTSPRSATPSRWRRGARSAGAARRRPAPTCGSSRARATRRPPTTRGARGRRRTAIPDGEQITSPKARYLQWKIELAGAERHAARW